MRVQKISKQNQDKTNKKKLSLNYKNILIVQETIQET